MYRKAKKITAVVLAGAVVASAGIWACDSCGCSSHTSTDQAPGHKHDHEHSSDIIATAVSAGNFKTLAAALKAAGLVEALQQKGPFTVFAPTDEAFAKLPEGTVATLLKPENRGLLTSVLTYHVVPGRVKAAQVVKLKNAKTLNGQQIAIRASDSGVKVDSANVIKTDIFTSNGVIHVIDAVIMPSSKDVVDTAIKSGSFNTLVAAVKAAGLVETLKQKGPYTVFAPSDKAFSRLPEGTVKNLLKPENKSVLVSILTYHVVPGRVFAGDVVKLSSAKTVNGQAVDIEVSTSGVTLDGAQVVATDVNASNGVIHVIDRVIMPSSDDLITTAVKAGSFKTLAAALTAGELVQALKQKGPFTVFAPTDEAFAKLPAGTVESLLKPENLSKLQGILKYHVVPGRIYSADAIAARSAKTLQGSPIRAASSSSCVQINNANVIKANIDATNGVIHVIDRVLLPNMEQTSVKPSPREQIVLAINHGSRLYNAGHHKACADLYMKTANDIMTTARSSVCHSVMDRLETAAAESKKLHSDNSRAWTMRHALDYALAAMPE